MNQLFKLTSRDVTAYIHAEDRQEAYAQFFLRVKKGEIKLDQLGGLLMSHEGKDEGDNVPFRVTPTLWLLELIPNGVAFAHIEKMLGVDSEEAAELLISSANQDMWILDKIKNLEALA